ncbi:hypothetical protein BC830DRAFT_350738 [Chytriomyces sp. MP71]|nr:hypothetical protein BC830DRAFT_350738 [Chytriomyces sp. MP71]
MKWFVAEPQRGSSSPATTKAILALLSLIKLINEAVGDALSNMFLVEASLTYQQMSFINGTQNTQTFLLARKNSRVESTFKPPILFKGDALFAPPEDIVRVYAETATREESDVPCHTICGIVFDGYQTCFIFAFKLCHYLRIAIRLKSFLKGLRTPVSRRLLLLGIPLFVFLTGHDGGSSRSI